MDDIFSIDPFFHDTGTGHLVDSDVVRDSDISEERRQVGAELGICLLPSGRRQRKICILRVDEDRNVSMTEEAGDAVICLTGNTGEADEFEIIAIPYQIPDIVPADSRTTWTESALAIETDILFPAPMQIHWLGGDTPPRHADPPVSALARLTDLNGKTTSHHVVFSGPVLKLPPEALEGLQLPVRFKVHIVR